MIYKEEKEGLGSLLKLEIHDDKVDHSLINKFWSEVNIFEARYSRFDGNSEISLLNANVGKWIEVSEEMLYFLNRVILLNSISFGYFDVFVEATLSGLGYDRDYSFKEKAFDFGKTNQIEIIDNKVKLTSTIDFGGFGKGYVLDLAKTYLSNFRGVYLNAGGDIWLKGLTEDQQKWKIYFENPQNLEEAIGFVETTDVFLASSNIKKRSWGKNHHLINPLLGQPANEMLGVFVQANEGFLVDAMSTTLFVMGYQKSKEFLLINPLVEALLISEKGEVWKTANFQGELFVQ